MAVIGNYDVCYSSRTAVLAEFNICYQHNIAIEVDVAYAQGITTVDMDVNYQQIIPFSIDLDVGYNTITEATFVALMLPYRDGSPWA